MNHMNRKRLPLQVASNYFGRHSKRGVRVQERTWRCGKLPRDVFRTPSYSELDQNTGRPAFRQNWGTLSFEEKTVLLLIDVPL